MNYTGLLIALAVAVVAGLAWSIGHWPAVVATCAAMLAIMAAIANWVWSPAR